jgi:hypothetical protein
LFFDCYHKIEKIFFSGGSSEIYIVGVGWLFIAKQMKREEKKNCGNRQ